MKKIVSLFGRHNELCDALNARAEAYAKEKGMEYVWRPMDPFTDAAAIDALKEADAGIIDIEEYDERIFSQINKRNRLLIRFGVGFDAVNLEDATKCGIKVARTQGANATGVAEYALLLIMALRRKLMGGIDCVKQGGWSKLIGNETIGATVGILGFGAVGRTFAKLLQGFGCRILVYDTYHDEAAAKALGCTFVDAETIFRESDAITIHLALNDATKGFVNEERIALMKPNAVIVNTARGPIVDDAALCKALVERRIGGAGLDVFTVEPIPGDDPYLKLDNVILTPHVASSTEESLWQIYESAIDIADHFFKGEPDKRMLN